MLAPSGKGVIASSTDWKRFVGVSVDVATMPPVAHCPNHDNSPEKCRETIIATKPLSRKCIATLRMNNRCWQTGCDDGFVQIIKPGQIRDGCGTGRRTDVTQLTVFQQCNAVSHAQRMIRLMRTQ